MVLDVNSKPEELLKVVNDLQAEQVKLASEGADLRKNLEEKANELRAVNQALTEQKQLASQTKADGPDREMLKYLKPVGAAGSDRAVMLKGYFDAETKEFIPGLCDDKQPVSEWQKGLQDLISMKNMIRLVWQSNKETPVVNARIRKHLAKAPDFIKKAAGWGDFEKAFADSSGVGAEWIIDLGLPTIVRDARLAGNVASLFQLHTMAAQTELVPFLSTMLRAYKHVPGTTDDPPQFTLTSLATAQRTMSSTGFVLRTQIDSDASEDALIAMMPFLNTEAILTLAYAEEDCLINGDSTATHQDAIATWDPRSSWGTSPALGGTADHRRTYIGLRARAYDVTNTTDGAATETYAGLLAWRAKLKAPLGILDNICHITSPEWALLKIFPMAELKTVDVFGDQATVKAGMPAAIGAAKIVLSDFMTADLAATGLFTGSGTTTGVISVNTTRHWVTQRLGNLIETEKDITRGVFNLVARNRRGFFTPDAASTKNVHFAFNLTGA